MIKPTDTEFTFTKMVRDTKENGRMIFNTGSEKKSGLIIVNTKDIILKVKNMVRVYIYGKMVLCITVIGLKIESKDMVNINGKTAECMSVNGKIIICTDKESILGLMEDDMKASMKWIKNMDLASTNGLMVEFTKVIGLMENNMDKENIYYKIRLSRLENG
jgi:hypothetical protein